MPKQIACVFKMDPMFFFISDIFITSLRALISISAESEGSNKNVPYSVVLLVLSPHCLLLDTHFK